MRESHAKCVRVGMSATVLVQLGQAESANYSYSELSYVSAKLYRSSLD